MKTNENDFMSDEQIMEQLIDVLANDPSYTYRFKKYTGSNSRNKLKKYLRECLDYIYDCDEFFLDSYDLGVAYIDLLHNRIIINEEVIWQFFKDCLESEYGD